MPRREYYQANKEKVKQSNKIYYINNKQKYSERSSNQYKSKREKFIDMYGNKCVCCGESHKEFLTIEHKLGQKGKKKEYSIKSYVLAIKEYQPDIYEILCMNCNHSKGTKGYCPHNIQ